MIEIHELIIEARIESNAASADCMVDPYTTFQRQESEESRTERIVQQALSQLRDELRDGWISVGGHR